MLRYSPTKLVEPTTRNGDQGVFITVVDTTPTLTAKLVSFFTLKKKIREHSHG